jgi:hypothetical protein
VQDVPHRARSHRVTKTHDLAVDPAVTPRRVLPRQPDHQLPDQHRDTWASTSWSRLRRIGPVPRDQLPVPAQQRRRRHDPCREQFARQHPCERSQHQPVFRLQPRTTHLPTQHRHLMPTHEQFDILRRPTTTASHHQSEQRPENRIQRREEHPEIMPNHDQTTDPRFLSPTPSELSRNAPWAAGTDAVASSSGTTCGYQRATCGVTGLSPHQSNLSCRDALWSRLRR